MGFKEGGGAVSQLSGGGCWSVEKGGSVRQRCAAGVVGLSAGAYSRRNSGRQTETRTEVSTLSPGSTSPCECGFPHLMPTIVELID